MRSHLPLSSFQASIGAAFGVLFMVLAIALAKPALAASPKPASKPAKVPNCTHFSLAKMAGLIHVSSLTYQGEQGSACTYTHASEGHYATYLAVSVEATPKSVFELAKQAFSKSATKQGKVFTSFTIGGAAAFSVYDVVDSANLPPCSSPDQPLPEQGPPLCNGEPTWEAIDVYAYGALKPKGPKVLVSVGFSAEVPSCAICVRSLNKAILSSQVH